jgi:uncharacterized membrane protein
MNILGRKWYSSAMLLLASFGLAYFIILRNEASPGYGAAAEAAPVVVDRDQGSAGWAERLWNRATAATGQGAAGESGQVQPQESRNEAIDKVAKRAWSARGMEERLAATRELGSMVRGAEQAEVFRITDALTRVLSDQEWEVRVEAAGELGKAAGQTPIEDFRIVDALAEALHDSEWQVRARAVLELGKIARTSSDRSRLISLFEGAAKQDPYNPVRSLSIVQLRSLRVPNW